MGEGYRIQFWKKGKVLEIRIHERKTRSGIMEDYEKAGEMSKYMKHYFIASDKKKGHFLIIFIDASNKLTKCLPASG